MDGEIIRFIREEIKKQVNIILSGSAGQNTATNEDINSQYPGSPTVPLRPVMHPYGFASQAPTGTIQVIARVGDHPGNRMVLGHRDSKRPAMQPGEAQLYNQFGQAIFLKNGEIHIGTATSNDPVPLGTELTAFLTSFIQLFVNHTHEGNLGYETPLNPSDAQTGNDLKENNLDNKAILSNYIFVDKGGG